jgi:hypothetical protein
MYLPDYTYDGFKNASIYIKNQPENLIKSEELLLDFKEVELKSSPFNPLLIFGIFAIIGLYITYKDYKNNTRTKFLDFILFFITGIIGCILVFLWFFSSHSTAPNNFNFLWAFAPNLIVTFLLLKNKHQKWLKGYLLISLVLLAIIPVLWIAKVQVFSLAIIPLLILFSVRYFYLLTSK